MYKKTFLIIFLTVSLNVLSQDKVVEVKIEDKKTLTAVKNSLDGYHYVKTSRQINKLIVASAKDGRLLSFDNDLNLVYDIEIVENDYIHNPIYKNRTEVSNFGNYYYNVTQLINKKGEIISSSYDRKSLLAKKGIAGSGKITPLFTFFNDFGYTEVGPLVGRKNQKGIYKDGDIKINTLKHDNLKPIFANLEYPNFTSDQKVFKWYKSSLLEDRFYMLSKAKISESQSKQNYYIVSYKYNGDLDQSCTLEVDLEDRSFLVSDNGNALYERKAFHYNNYSISHFYHNLSNNTFSIFGFYTNEPKKGSRVGKAEGVFVHKYNDNGELIWKNKYPLEKVKNEYLVYRNIYYEEIGDTGFLKFSTKSDKDYHLLTINSTNGILKEKKKDFYKEYNVNNSNRDKKEVSIFKAIYSKKSLPKKYLSDKVITSLIINKEVQKYIENTEPNSYLYYDSTICLDGSIILKEFNGKDRILKLLKFSKKD